jgi:hypothetical protein
MPTAVKGLLLLLLAFVLGLGVTSLLLDGLKSLGYGLDAFSNSVGIIIGLAIVSIGGVWATTVFRDVAPLAIAIGMASVAASVGVMALSIMAAIFFLGERGRQPMAGAGAIALALITSGIMAISARQTAFQIRTWIG